VKGFDYRTGQGLDLPVRDLASQLQAVVDAGGYRRVEHGETFAHDVRGSLLWEAYGIVPAPRDPIRDAVNRATLDWVKHTGGDS